MFSNKNTANKNKELNIETPLINNTNSLKYTTSNNPLNSSLKIEMSAKIYPTCEYVLNFDGCSKGNPGPAGIGAVITRLGKEEWSGCQYIGKKTNNQSEYSALIFGLKEAVSRDIKQLQVFGDSLLVINQITGLFKVKNVLLQDLYNETMDLISKFDYIELSHVYRKFNKRADQLSNMALETCEYNL